jgi:hypothetical protein
MDDQDDLGYEHDEGSDIDNWETEQVFQDHEGDDDFEEPSEDDCEAAAEESRWGRDNEGMGMNEQIAEDRYLDSMFEDRYDSCLGDE